MKVSRLSAHTILVLLLLTFLSVTLTAQTARADDNDEQDDFDVKARVVRISLIVGEATMQRNGNKDWERARINYPLVEGDAVATDKDSRLEIQFDARNFIRLAPSTVLRIVTLRDQGTAVSVLEGSATLRLAKFERGEAFFEIDAPRITMAPEKAGLYRVDVPREGRVRLTVRDGGNARIYSETSGFALRDGRSAELIATGDNAGDWDLLAAAPRDANDEWVDERDRDLAARIRYDVKYTGDDVWGAEELAAYGDWIQAKDYGWIWRPHPSVLSAYADWAPYRYGHWTWCPPYGWTWVGYEPWGWAPYHYGRWVTYNGYWAWVPRSQFDRNRRWWRPALVAFVSFDFSFGDNICWYPLSYYQRDPHSRYYRHHDRHPGNGGGGRGGYAGGGRDGGGRDGGGRDGGGRDGGGRRYDAEPDKTWRGVTRVPRRDFGNGSLGRPVEETAARRVVESEPETENLPRRAADLTGAVPSPDRERDTPIIQRPTGAAQRAPGVELDDELQRSRIFHGREPRHTQPAPPQTQPTQSTQSTQSTSTQSPQQTSNAPTPAPEPPVGAVERPAPVRVVRPSNSDDADKRVRGQQGIERHEPRAESPRSESPRAESPRSEPPRSEPPRSEPPRAESPRSEPRSAPPRSESPRSESPRSEPAPRSESPRSESPRSESPRSESPRSESPRSESPRSESPRSESPRPVESPRSESPRSEGPKRPDNL